MVLKAKEVERAVNKKTCTQREIAEELKISEGYLSQIKSGLRKLNPNNPRHRTISKKLQRLTA